jgi:hypothetical protein
MEISLHKKCATKLPPNNHSMKHTTVMHTRMLKGKQMCVHTVVVKCVIMHRDVL